MNIVLFGEAGVGKSSIINMMAGRKVADTSDWGCTSESKQYTFHVEGSTFNIWDTIGLGDPAFSVGTVEKTYTLIQEIKAQGRLDLLLFCIPGSRVTSTMQYNYRLFFEVLCEKQIPIAVVVTRLDGEARPEDWWVRNSEFLSQCGLQFSGHACVLGRPGHPKEAEGRAALESFLLGYDQGGRYPMPPTFGFSGQLSRVGSELTIRSPLSLRLEHDDIVVFVVGPSESENAMFVLATQIPGFVVFQGRQPIRCKLTAEGKTALGAEYIVFNVNTPLLEISGSYPTRVGAIYMQRIETDPTAEKEYPMQHHLDTFAKTLPKDFVTRAFPMRLHCVFSNMDEIREEKFADHREKLQKQLNNLRSRIVHGSRVVWNTSIHPDLFVKGNPDVAWQAVEKLFS